MDGIHDVGGMQGLGVIAFAPSEPVFHHDWEGRIFALLGALGASGFTVDEYRWLIEQMPASQYLSTTYYEKWVEVLTQIVVSRGFATQEELAAAVAEEGDQFRD